MIFTPGKQRKIIHCNLMQAALGAVQNPRCAVVIHNVRSCSKVVWDAFRSLGEKYREITGNRKMDGFLFCTGLTDQDAVFGGNEKLRRCLEDICDEIHPEVILVVCGCVPGVIGDDTEALCQEVEAETGTTVVLLPGHGFMVPGLVDTVTSMARLLFDTWTLPQVKAEKDREICLVSGLSPAYSSPEEYHELMEVLRLLGFTRILCPPVGVSRNDYMDMGRASQVVSFTRGAFQEQASTENALYMAHRLDVPMVNWTHVRTPAESRRAVHGKSCRMQLGITRQAEGLRQPVAFLRAMGIEDITIVLAAMIPREDEASIRSVVETECGALKWSRQEVSADVRLSTVSFDLRQSQEILIPSCLGYAGWISFITQIVKTYGGCDE